LYTTGFQSDLKMGLTSDVGRILEELFVPRIIVGVKSCPFEKQKSSGVGTKTIKTGWGEVSHLIVFQSFMTFYLIKISFSTLLSEMQRWTGIIFFDTISYRG
jgi:hypothetical protein